MEAEDVKMVFRWMVESLDSRDLVDASEDVFGTSDGKDARTCLDMLIGYVERMDDGYVENFRLYPLSADGSLICNGATVWFDDGEGVKKGIAEESRMDEDGMISILVEGGAHVMVRADETLTECPCISFSGQEVETGDILWDGSRSVVAVKVHMNGTVSICDGSVRKCSDLSHVNYVALSKGIDAPISEMLRDDPDDFLYFRMGASLQVLDMKCNKRKAAMLALLEIASRRGC